MHKYSVALFFAVFLSAVNFYSLWVPASEHVEGDVLIHLVLARNIADGRPFEYSPGQHSNAGTAPLWEGVLAGVGKATGTLNSNEGFFAVSRVLSGLCLLISAGLFYRMVSGHSQRSIDALIAVLLITVNPITIYWCLVCPMETALAMVLTASVLLSTHHSQRDEEWKNKHALQLVFFTVLIYLVRPEMALLPVILGLVQILSKPNKIRNIIRFALFGAMAFALVALFLHLMGGSLLPGAASSRQICHKLLNTVMLPVVGWRINSDALLMAVLFFPLSGLLLWKSRTQEKIDWISISVLLSLLVLTLFFTGVFCTTWRGRYLLPIYSAVIALAIPKWNIGSSTKRTIVAIGYIILLNMALLYPLAKHQPGPIVRNAYSKDVNYYTPLPNEKRALVQEVQGAYYYPEIEFISTDGLVEGSLIKAWKDGLTYYEYIMQCRPDLISEVPVILLADPDGMLEKISTTTKNKRAFKYKDLNVNYAGVMKGSGPVLHVEYPALP